MNNTLILSLPISSTSRFRIKGLKVLWIFISILMSSLLVVCIFQIGAYTKEVYLIQSYEKKLNQLTLENKILEVNFSEVNSLNNVGNYVQNSVFEKANKIDYIRLLEGTALAK
ncbi:MAG: hypothetical protein COX92_00030 [Candidatus Nealsonbacteria bacterium CG_4_10_14_0_2_um_filter_40_15]|uniref:Cell division protein FtsL n=1 Tax=Candidatus Nealsonbacteria bacterium CG_4_10_14_0_2_um_filter_40_15 TaxID=1974682 RepID=A0A2M7UV92_9BACT|nr:MAG: hypothetical protein COX92_00030 [Candidatus Nealsonbacteria bacterium CG_4_10_14_0_2_um_filter_40_15]